MMILSLVRNYIPSYQWVVKGGWNIADCVMRSYDVEGMHVGTVAGGRIGLAVLRRLEPFDVHLYYTDRHRLPKSIEKELDVTFHKTAAEMIPVCDVVTINAPLHPETENLFRRSDVRSHEARHLFGEYRPRQDLQSGRRCSRAGKRPTRRLCRRCVVSAAGAIRGGPCRITARRRTFPAPRCRRRRSARSAKNI
jgi:hypothetical protein